MKKIKYPVRKSTRIALSIVVATVLVVVLSRCLSRQKGPDYLTAPVVRADIENTVQAIGTVRAFKQVDVGARVTGQVQTLHVQLGDSVKKGQLLAEIDPVLAKNELQKTQLSAEESLSKRRIVAAQLEQIELNMKRQQQLLAEDAAPRQELEKAEAELKSKRAELAGLDAQVKRARVEVETARVNLDYTQIVAPIDGEVVSMVADVGQMVIAQQQVPVIMKLADLETITVQAQIPEADVVRVHTGQEVYFTILGASEQRYYSRLRVIEPAPTTANKEAQQAVFYNALFEVPNSQRVLRVGMTAQVSVVLDQASAALTIPVSALDEQDKSGRARVRVLKADGTVQTRTVRTGINNRVQVQILSGLKEGEHVILDDPLAMKEGNAHAHPSGGRIHLRG